MAPHRNPTTLSRGFLEVETGSGEKIRLTFIPKEKSADKKSAGIRIQIVEANGHIRRGPEIPVNAITEVFEAANSLMRKNS